MASNLQTLERKKTQPVQNGSELGKILLPMSGGSFESYSTLGHWISAFCN